MMTVSNALAYCIKLFVSYHPIYAEVDLGIFFANKNECIQLAQTCKVQFKKNHIELYFNDQWVHKIGNEELNKYQFFVPKTDHHSDSVHLLKHVHTSEQLSIMPHDKSFDSIKDVQPLNKTIEDVYQNLQQMFPNQDKFLCQSHSYLLVKEI